MQDFLLIYQGGDPEWVDKSVEEKQAVMAEWNEWCKELEASGNLRNPGAPLEASGTVLANEGDGISTDTTMPEVKELIGGFSMIQAESIEQATELAKGVPFLKHSSTGRVHVRPVMSPPAAEG